MIDAKFVDFIEQFQVLLTLRERARELLRNPPLPGTVSTEDEFDDFGEFLEKFDRAAIQARLRGASEAVLWAKYNIQGKRANIFEVYQYSEHIYAAVLLEMCHSQFFKLKKPEYYSRIDDPKRTKMFGEQVELSFPRSIPEIISACNCFALEEWTASVFHCMRVLESPLVAMAKKFNVAYDTREWHNIIEGIEKEIRKIAKDTYGPTWKEDEKFFGEAARHFMFLKNAMRNHVMHVRDEYDEGRALSILQHTKEFTTHLAPRLADAP